MQKEKVVYDAERERNYLQKLTTSNIYTVCTERDRKSTRTIELRQPVAYNINI